MPSAIELLNTLLDGFSLFCRSAPLAVSDSLVRLRSPSKSTTAMVARRPSTTDGSPAMLALIGAIRGMVHRSDALVSRTSSIRFGDAAERYATTSAHPANLLIPGLAATLPTVYVPAPPACTSAVTSAMEM